MKNDLRIVICRRLWISKVDRIIHTILSYSHLCHLVHAETIPIVILLGEMLRFFNVNDLIMLNRS